jgi:hypothetical protein
MATATLIMAVGCAGEHRGAESGAVKTFSSPDEAGAAVVAASRSGDQQTLLAIFGPNSKTVLFTGDSATDRANLKGFATAYDQMHRWGEIKAGGQVLQVGPENTPFPIPLGRNAAGRYYFDTAAGRDEILARRIGKNELGALDATAALAGAEQQYYDEKHQYAAKFVSDPGKQDGLFRPAPEGQTSNPFATAASGNPEVSGYRYRILTKGAQDFAILAYPVEYRNSGIMSFLVGKDGTVYQKDLGERTADVASAMTDYNPGNGWTATNASLASASAMEE